MRAAVDFWLDDRKAWIFMDDKLGSLSKSRNSSVDREGTDNDNDFRCGSDIPDTGREVVLSMLASNPKSSSEVHCASMRITF